MGLRINRWIISKVQGIHFQLKLRLCPEESNATDVISNKGIVLIKLGYFTEVIKIFDKILSINPNNVVGLYNKGTCLDKLGHNIQAKELHNKALKINPNYTEDSQNRVALVSKFSKSQEASTFAPSL